MAARESFHLRKVAARHALACATNSVQIPSLFIYEMAIIGD